MNAAREILKLTTVMQVTTNADVKARAHRCWLVEEAEELDMIFAKFGAQPVQLKVASVIISSQEPTESSIRSMETELGIEGEARCGSFGGPFLGRVSVADWQAAKMKRQQNDTKDISRKPGVRQHDTSVSAVDSRMKRSWRRKTTGDSGSPLMVKTDVS